MIRLRRPRSWLVIGVLSFALASSAASCNHPPSSLTPAGVVDYRANEAVVALGTLQHTAIALNGIAVCPTAVPPTPCHPILSDTNTRYVIDGVTAAIETIKVSPGGWKATTLTVLTQISQRLDALGQEKLTPYIEAARTVVIAIEKE